MFIDISAKSAMIQLMKNCYEKSKKCIFDFVLAKF